MRSVLQEVLGDLLKVFHVGGAECVVLEMLSVVLEVLRVAGGVGGGGVLRVFHVGGAERFAGGVG